MNNITLVLFLSMIALSQNACNTAPAGSLASTPTPTPTATPKSTATPTPTPSYCEIGNRSTNTPYAAGSGTSGDPYTICTATQLNAIGSHSSHWDKSFQLQKNIDLSSYTGTQFNSIGLAVWDSTAHDIDSGSSTPVSGTFDGGGFQISNFTITNANSDFTGLFNYVTGTVKNLTLALPQVSGGLNSGSLIAYLNGTVDTVTATSATVTGSDAGSSDAGYGANVGGLIGEAGGLASIHRALVQTANVQGKKSGGLVGYFVGNSLSQSSSSGSVVGVVDGGDAGGLIGVLGGTGTLSQIASTATVSITANAGEAGGLIGIFLAEPTVTDCYATGSVSTVSGDAGGLVGEFSSDGAQVVLNCYTTQNTFFRTDDGNGGYETASFYDDGMTDLYNQSTFTGAGWDFTSTWRMPSSGTPVLQWQ